MKVPDRVFRTLKDELYARADSMGWQTMNDRAKSLVYEGWIGEDKIGGVLSRYLAPGSVRVYIKDTIMKPYSRERIADPELALRLAGISSEAAMRETFIKPHGRRMSDGRVICWGLARDWKAILMSVFERSFDSPPELQHAAVLLYPRGRQADPVLRSIVEDAAKRLGVEKLAWFDG